MLPGISHQSAAMEADFLCRNIIAHLPGGFNRVFVKNADELKVMVSLSGMNKRLQFAALSGAVGLQS